MKAASQLPGFASDNQAGVHPAVVEAISLAAKGHAPPYGDDEWTAHAEGLFRKHFGPDALAFQS